jgi:protein O-GlcNAc transferase
MTEEQTLTIQQAIDLALQHHTAGDLPKAEGIYQQILQVDPNQPFALHLLGVITHQVGKNDIAVDLINKAITIKPNFAEAHYNLGIVLQALGRIDEAEEHFSRAIVIKPDYFEAHSNLGNVFKELGKIDEAIKSYNNALNIKPDYAEAHNNLGVAFKDLGKLDEAIYKFNKALELEPDLPEAHSNILQTEQYRLGQNSKNLYKIHKDWDKRHAQRFQATWPKHLNTPDIGRILRIGFVSPDLGRHPVGYFLVQFFEKILKTEIETVIYSNRLIHNLDDLSDRVKAASSFWRDVNGIPDDKLAKIILGDKIDILFDLTGHFSENRLLLFARKPAPIQVSWAGYVGTTGLSAMDYLLSDIHSTPLDEEKYYSEQIIRMAAWICYEPPAYAPEVGPSPFKKNGHMTFSSFCNPAKINEEVISVWAIIMNKIEGSCLIIKYKGIDSAANIKRLRTKFEAQGIDKSRLTLEGKSSHVDLLARYNDVDITLDTFPYSGGLTTFESLWMGVPVISVPGKTFASRHSLSHLSTIGLPELVAKDKDDYVRLTVELAKDAERMVELRVGLRSRMANSPICDGDKFSRNFTTLMKKIWRDWCFTQDK